MEPPHVPDPVQPAAMLTHVDWLWIESIPALLQGKVRPVEVLFLPPWEEEDDAGAESKG